MAELTAVVVAKDDPEGFRRTLESLCEQSVETFEVLLVLRDADADVRALAKTYCDEYVGFAALETGACLIPEARNAGAAAANTPLLLFLDAGDYLAPESMESFLKTAAETNADILSPRLYISGENEPYYDVWMDLLATVPRADRFDNALLNTLNAPGRVYRKKYFDLYSLRFPAQPTFFVAAFTAECVFKCDAAVAGCAGAIYDDRHGVFACGFPDGGEPNGENLKRLIALYNDILQTAQALIEESTGGFDGDEAAFQELLFVFFTALTDGFYRYFWYLSDGDLKLLLQTYEALSARMTKERRDKIATAFKDLRFPNMYMTRKDAANLPMVSLIAEFADEPASNAFIRSLYHGRLPFFELFLKESNKKYVDEKWRKNENLHFLDDAGFFAAARAASRSLTISVKDPAPLDPKILSELATVRAPKSFYQYLFASKRKKYSAKTFLKKRGMNMK